jgi:hypothetical protein
MYVCAAAMLLHINGKFTNGNHLFNRKVSVLTENTTLAEHFQNLIKEIAERSKTDTQYTNT